MLKLYMYQGCGSCRKAVTVLDAKRVDYTAIPIREQPPTRKELHEMLAAQDGNIRKLFNTTGGSYRSLNLKEKLPRLSLAEQIDLLAEDGSLVKRPFLIGDGVRLVGFQPAAWEAALS